MNQFRSARFHVENIIYRSYKTSYLKEKVNYTEASKWVSIPCSGLTFCDNRNNTEDEANIHL